MPEQTESTAGDTWRDEMFTLDRSGRFLKVSLRSERSKVFHCDKAEKSVLVVSSPPPSVVVVTAGEGAAEGTTEEEKIRAEEEGDEKRENRAKVKQSINGDEFFIFSLFCLKRDKRRLLKMKILEKLFSSETLILE